MISIPQPIYLNSLNQKISDTFLSKMELGFIQLRKSKIRKPSLPVSQWNLESSCVRKDSKIYVRWELKELLFSHLVQKHILIIWSLSSIPKEISFLQIAIIGLFNVFVLMSSTTKWKQLLAKYTLLNMQQIYTFKI